MYWFLQTACPVKDKPAQIHINKVYPLMTTARMSNKDSILRCFQYAIHVCSITYAFSRSTVRQGTNMYSSNRLEQEKVYYR